MGRATRTRTCFETRPNRSVHLPSEGKRNVPPHAFARRLRRIGYRLPLGATATILLQVPVAGTATVTTSPTRGAFKLTAMTGVGAGAPVAATANAAATSNARTLVQRLTIPL